MSIHIPILTLILALCAAPAPAWPRVDMALMVVPSGAPCAGVKVYYDNDRECSWREVSAPSNINRVSRVASHAVDHTHGPLVEVEGARHLVATRYVRQGAKGGVTPGIHFARLVGRTLEDWPRFLLDLLPYDLMVTTAHTGGYFPRYCLGAYHTGCGDTRLARHIIAFPEDWYVNDRDADSKRGYMDFHHGVEELLFHEFAHTLQHSTHQDWWRLDDWKEAMAADGEDVFVTEYAKTNVEEDFAESFAAWIVLNHPGAERGLGAPARENILRIKNRLEYFDNQLRRNRFGRPGYPREN